MPDQQSPFVTNNNSQSSSATPPPLRPAPSAVKPPLEAPHDLPVGSGAFSIPGMPSTPAPATSSPAPQKSAIPPLTPPPVAVTPPATPMPSAIPPKPTNPSPTATPITPEIPPKPVAPLSPSPASQPAPAPLAPKPAQAPTPAVPSAPATPQNISSSIRTMQSDLDALSQGKAPAGIPLEKKPEIPTISNTPAAPKAPSPAPSSSSSGFTPPKPMAPSSPSPASQPAPIQKPITPTPLPTPPPSPTITAPKPVAPAPSSSFSIPNAPAPSSTPVPQKPLTPSATPTPPPASSMPFTPPSVSSGSRSKILPITLGIVILAIAGISAWLYISNNSEVAVTSPSATPKSTVTETPTPTPSQLTLANALGTPDNLALPANADPQLAINAVINNISLNAGGIRTFRILDSDNITPLTLKDFLTKISVTMPTQTSSASAVLTTKDWVLGVYGQVNSDTPTANAPVTKKIFLVADVGTNTSGASQLLQIWETTLINDFATLFRYTKPAKSLKFISDSYNGTPFRYVEIPNKYSGLGYAIVNNYLFLESSRDTFRTIVSRLLTIQ